MTILETVKERYADVKDRIAKAAQKAGRDAEDITLVAVTKYTGAEEIRELMALGHRDFGENHVQQLIQRASMITEWQARQKSIGHAAAEPVRWHMIGHLQRNKVRKGVEFSRLIHSVDSLRLAEEIQGIAIKLDQVVDVLVQVNCSGEASKYGCAVAAAAHLAEQIDTMINVRVRGLMTIAPYSANPEDSRECFVRLRELFTEIAKSGMGARGSTAASGSHFNILSMGMSGDFEVAISEGSNLVRIGSAIFGEKHGAGDDANHDVEE